MEGGREGRREGRKKWQRRARPFPPLQAQHPPTPLPRPPSRPGSPVRGPPPPATSTTTAPSLPARRNASLASLARPTCVLSDTEAMGTSLPPSLPPSLLPSLPLCRVLPGLSLFPTLVTPFPRPLYGRLSPPSLSPSLPFSLLPSSLSGGCQPPNLINTLISIALAPGTVTEPMFGGQSQLQVGREGGREGGRREGEREGGRESIQPFHPSLDVVFPPSLPPLRYSFSSWPSPRSRFSSAASLAS
jgi:hypothetical protein